MTSATFDALTRSLTVFPSHRGVLRGLSALAMSMTAAQVPDRAAAKKTRNRNNPKKNEFGCIDVGKKCNGKNNKCCSGACQGRRTKKKDTSKCIAHNVLTCQDTDDACQAEDAIPCGTGALSRGFQTTGKASFCGDLGGSDCVPCGKDADCESDFGPGAACVVCAGCGIFGPTACFPPGA